PPASPLFPYTTLFRSVIEQRYGRWDEVNAGRAVEAVVLLPRLDPCPHAGAAFGRDIDNRPAPHTLTERAEAGCNGHGEQERQKRDRKSTRLNSSHVKI